MRLLHILFPFLSWKITSESLRADLIAGVSVALVLIPQSMAYAQLAGVPPIYGLYAALLPALFGVLWGSSYHLASGPTAMSSLLTMATLVAYATPGTPEYVKLAVLLTFLVGLVRIFVGVFRLSILVNFISQPVVRGFTNAGALIIAISQISKILGIKMNRTSFFLGDIWDVATRVTNEFHLPTFILGVGTIVIIYTIKKTIPRVPSALVVAVFGSLAVLIFKLADPRVVDPAFTGGVADGARFVTVLGRVPAGLPEFSAPPITFKTALGMLPGACVVMFIGFMEVCSVTKAVSAKSKQRINLNQELVGQGISALAGSFSSCFPTGGSFSRTALNYSAGGKTGMCSVFTVCFVLLTLLFMTDFLVYLPQAVLAGIIIMAVVGLFDFDVVKKYWTVSKLDGVACWITFAASLIFAPNIVNGILIGAAVAIFLHLFKTMRPKVTMYSHHGPIKKDKEGDVVDRHERYPEMRFDGRLYFANVSYFENTVLKIIQEFPDLVTIIVRGRGINELDASGEAMLRELVGQIRERGLDIVFQGLKPQITSTLDQTGLTEIIGKDHFFDRSEDVRSILVARSNHDEADSYVI